MKVLSQTFSTALACIAAVGLITACGPQASGRDARAVSGDGFGPAKFGMKIDDAAKTLGVKLQPDNPDGVDDDACRYYHPANAFPGLSFMTADGVIVRLDLYDSQAIATDAGAKIGATEQHVLELYKGRVRVKPHFYAYSSGWHYLEVTGGDGKVQMVFETDGKTVVNYRAGREPQVQYVEGCS